MVPGVCDLRPWRGAAGPGEGERRELSSRGRAGNEVAVMTAKRVVVIGGNFGGFTAALEVKAELGADVEVTVVSAAARFLFNPSLIWLPFGKRKAADITFALEPVFDAHGIGFVHAEATAIDPVARTVATAGGSYGY